MLKVTFAIPCYYGKAFFSDRENAALAGTRIAIIEHAKLGTGDVLLDDRPGLSIPQISFQFSLRPCYRDARASLPSVWFQNHGKVQAIFSHEGFSAGDTLGQAGRGLNGCSPGNET